MNSSSAPVTTPPKQAATFPHLAARASWASGVMVFLLISFGGRTDAKALIELIALVLMLVGFALGAIALLGIPRHGTKQLLAPALVGLIINGLLLFIFINNFLAARAKAQRHTRTLPSAVATHYPDVPLRKNSTVSRVTV